MRIKLSIFTKLLLVIIPLVCIPVALVAYYSVQASVERVNHLVRQEQMVQVEAAAQKINDILHGCRTELETISRLPVLEDYHLAKSFRLQAEADFNRANLIRISKDFMSRSLNYFQIRFLDRDGKELIKVLRRGPAAALKDCSDEDYFKQARKLSAGASFFSPVLEFKERGGYVIHAATPFFTGWREFAGLVVIDLDFEQVIRIVRAIRTDGRGYSFLVDELGRNIVHPVEPPYAFNLINYPEPSLRELVNEMVDGGSGWFPYTFKQMDKVAAYAPIPAMGWSLAVTIPIEEFGREARGIRSRVVQVVAVTLAATLLCVSILSYNLVRPVRTLVEATNRIAHGDLETEIPVASGDELGELTRSFNRMTRNLARTQAELLRSEKLISLGRLSAGVAHEIRNPLNAMKGAMVHLRQRWRDDPLIKEYTSLVSEEIDRLNRVVSEFLFFAKQAPPKPRALDLNELLLSSQKLLAEVADKKGLEFENYLEAGLPIIQADQHQIEQVILNLMINAMDAMQKGGEIIVVTKSQGPWVELIIKDHGTGISEKSLHSIFDPFFTTKEDGTGLGLPLSLGIVEAHGGSLEIKSRSSSGTKVVVRLPLGGPKEA